MHLRTVHASHGSNRQIAIQNQARVRRTSKVWTIRSPILQAILTNYLASLDNHP
jgi:hypothetical protein